MLKRIVKDYSMPKLLGKVFPKNKTSFLYGESGVGKTISTIKALNEDKITPILLDYDNNLSPEFNECEYIHIDAHSISKGDKIVSDKVVIVDTYAKMNSNTVEKLTDINTVIIIGHSKGIATKNDIPDAPDEYVNHMDAKLFLQYIKKGDSYDLTVMKCRGYSGDRVIKNWMRD